MRFLRLLSPLLLYWCCPRRLWNRRTRSYIRPVGGVLFRPGCLAKNPFPQKGSLGKEQLPVLSTVGGCDEVWLRFARRLFVSMQQCVPRELFLLGFAIVGFAAVAYSQTKLDTLVVLEKLMFAWIRVRSPSRCHRCVADVTSYFCGVGGY